VYSQLLEYHIRYLPNAWEGSMQGKPEGKPDKISHTHTHSLSLSLSHSLQKMFTINFLSVLGFELRASRQAPYHLKHASSPFALVLFLR
jgi:hypothetical protein